MSRYEVDWFPGLIDDILRLKLHISTADRQVERVWSIATCKVILPCISVFINRVVGSVGVIFESVDSGVVHTHRVDFANGSPIVTKLFFGRVHLVIVWILSLVGGFPSTERHPHPGNEVRRRDPCTRILTCKVGTNLEHWYSDDSHINIWSALHLTELPRRLTVYYSLSCAVDSFH